MNNSKIRLSSIFKKEVRKKLCLSMAKDVFRTLSLVNEVDEVVVVSSDKTIMELASEKKFKIIKEEKDEGVNKAVLQAILYAIDHGASSTLILPADVPLIQPSDIQQIINRYLYEKSVLIVPSIRRDGTNALLMKPPNIIETSYDKMSFRTHIQFSFNKNIKLYILMIRNLMLDIDNIYDVQEFIRKKNMTETYKILSTIVINRNKIL
jgi:2-phospho-L-lactate guanylyltransferase